MTLEQARLLILGIFSNALDRIDITKERVITIYKNDKWDMNQYEICLGNQPLPNNTTPIERFTLIHESFSRLRNEFCKRCDGTGELKSMMGSPLAKGFELECSDCDGKGFITKEVKQK